MRGTAGMSIGEVARRTGLQPSAIRYYESLGLLPKPSREGGKRRYADDVLDWLALVALARESGFTMAEIRELVRGFTPDTPPARRWHALATRKLAELDALVARTERMRAVLQVALACGCLRLEDCGHLLAGSAPTLTGNARTVGAAPTRRGGKASPANRRTSR